MDWSRAKNILIVAFIILNLFLAAQLNQAIEQRSRSLGNDKLTNSEINNLLKDNQIQLVASRPDEPSSAHFYKAVHTSLPEDWKKDAQGVYQKTFQIPFKDPKELDKLLQKEVPYFTDYQLSTHHSIEKNKRVYLQMLDGKPFFDGKLEVYLSGNQIQSVRIIHFKPTQTPAEKVVPLNNALYRLITSGEVDKNSKIHAIQLGYKAKVYYANEDYILVPHWRFYINNQMIDVNATAKTADDNVEISSD
ncbi:two-component system regulatory protein YycI [Hazenella coriacea]|uniref:Regulatory protein YycI of two-component signal transduction system YycFG n=1 Tax=Hazenella coriacea TaxID=1179467 RepID=A0A4R3L8L8_9BACL|nr:two-component system regulatory protein YycI [Hazenella coriacea]TCS95518.1 regulatory protein YycI of two-component signal transduction system YycFG [Hazenella coriacea]